MVISVAKELRPVIDVTTRLRALLQRAKQVKLGRTVDPPLPDAGLIEEVSALHEDFTDEYEQTLRFTAVETAAREVFYSLISATNIEDSDFVQVWNLLDILLICSDEGKCAPELCCWLIEELLDSQTTHGCRIVFDYLETRRERLARRDFHKKNLIFLRSCNELLRRLSRTEDAIFCGRVFFFLFQTFPLGDKSSVNLRGEFHTENTTKFEVSSVQSDQDGEKMDIDPPTSQIDTATPKASTPQPQAKPGSKAVPVKAPPKKEEEVVLSADALYGVFWRLQQDFSDPTRIFTASNFQTFKKGLDGTIIKFKKTPTVVQTQATDNGKRGTKRRLDGDTITNDSESDGPRLVDNYNPKYLTSRDLFDLELSDLAFQRHILVQSLILIDFLLSLTEKAKKRLSALETTNKSMLYSFTLNEDDTKWATATRMNITNYLSASPEGRLFNRMVETVLARDKNWIRWKVESCPSIVRDPVSTISEVSARKGVRDATKIRRLPERPNGATNVSFLDEGLGGGLESLKSASRYTAPLPTELLEGMQTDELDLDFEDSEEQKIPLQNAIANKRWKLLRQTRASRLTLLDKVEPGADLSKTFRPSEEVHDDMDGHDTEPEQDSGGGGPRVEGGDDTEQQNTAIDGGESEGSGTNNTAAALLGDIGGSAEPLPEDGRKDGERMEAE